MMVVKKTPQESSGNFFCAVYKHITRDLVTKQRELQETQLVAASTYFRSETAVRVRLQRRVIAFTSSSWKQQTSCTRMPRESTSTQRKFSTETRSEDLRDKHFSLQQL
jgi:hypothetical protein